MEKPKVELKNGVPRNMRVLVKQDPLKTSIGGLFIPESSQEKYRPTTGKVVGIDPDIKNMSLGLKVLFHKDAGIALTINTEDLLLLHMNEILMTYEEGEISLK